MSETRSLLAIRDLGREQIEELLTISAEMKLRVVNDDGPLPDLSRNVVGMLFFENSTRTRVSFEQAAHYLRMKTATFTQAGSSMSKGETLKDTILTLRYERLSGLVMRHRMSGAPYLASRYFSGPVLNAGDGEHEHPTQALGDALTVMERKGSASGLRVAIVGDILHSRVARSNAWLFSKMGSEVRFVGPRTLMPSHTGMLPGDTYFDLADGIDDADVIICLRLQRERMEGAFMSSVNEYAKLYQINRDTLRLASKDCLIMHPGPLNRGVELDDAAADGENSVINSQVENGVFVRMAALYWTFGGGTEPVRTNSTKASKPAQRRAPPARSRP